ncbi:MAG: hypothetical protein VYD57_17060 [Pseudomonadota bacterium]|nr:hypothetical protein [Pseudomonadota bacterium]
MSDTPSFTVAVCLSIGRHPVSGRPRMAPCDRQALEMAIASGHHVAAFHAGPGDEAVLRDYLGMGVGEISHLELGDGADILAALTEALAALDPALVLFGDVAEIGPSSGLLPYMVAEMLSRPILTSVTGFELRAGELAITQAAAGGRRRLRRGVPPAVLAVSRSAPAPRLSAYARARAGKILTHPATGEAPSITMPELRPAKRQSARLRPGRNAEAATGRRLVEDVTAEDAAQEILEFLARAGFEKALPFADTQRAKNGNQNV